LGYFTVIYSDALTLKFFKLNFRIKKLFIRISKIQKTTKETQPDSQ